MVKQVDYSSEIIAQHPALPSYKLENFENLWEKEMIRLILLFAGTNKTFLLIWNREETPL